MYNKAKQHLKSIISSCDNNTVAIMDDDLFYESNGKVIWDQKFQWGVFFDDIINDSEFITDIDNMQLIVQLKTN